MSAFTNEAADFESVMRHATLIMQEDTLPRDQCPLRITLCEHHVKPRCTRYSASCRRLYDSEVYLTLPALRNQLMYYAARMYLPLLGRNLSSQVYGLQATADIRRAS